MRSVEEVAREIPNATVFSKLDAKSGFLQIKLDEDSSKLTTFNTPLGRCKWLRLPFGLKCSPEIFQKIMDQMLEGIDGAFAIMDDILIAGKDLQHHDEILKKVLRRATDYNLKLNLEKVRIRQKSVGYCGHVISAEGLKADPEKIKAVREMPRPHDKESLRRFLGFVTYLGKFIPNLSQEDQPLRQLLKAENIFQWEDQQKKAFDKLKDLCVKAPVLQYFDVNKPVEVHCDASCTGLGAVLVQDNKPVAYSSRSLTDTETKYAQIEKEMLAIVHACKKFHCFIFGKEVTVFTDHKPLEQIFKKQLLAAPMRLQRMLLTLQWYDITVTYRKGKDMQVPDTLSRAYLQESVAEIDINQVNASDLRSSSVIEALKQNFSIHGIPNKIRTDCETQFTSQEFQDFCQGYNIQHHMVYPHHQSANGKAEKAVQIVKRLWTKCKDKYMAVLDFNTTPLENVKASPANFSWVEDQGIYFQQSTNCSNREPSTEKSSPNSTTKCKKLRSSTMTEQQGHYKIFQKRRRFDSSLRRDAKYGYPVPSSRKWDRGLTM
ncbi:transposon Ty3-I Gag-Pol polyprotein [Elysia marginata]|uniref:Transposon Ty3-I Gag-Pol polyprotein n=1 Tax=Elysia marginata TaxID=1093978 RepID=A0AAV4H875_9GAST|nr:transposon Ty3-I Gag-Pol polyprotein [Elysia marginata]